jgi:hypothetical protein
VVGQDSLTRLDDKVSRKRANKKRNKKPKGASAAITATANPVQVAVESAELKQIQASTENEFSNNRNNTRRKSRNGKDRSKPKHDEARKN